MNGDQNYTIISAQLEHVSIIAELFDSYRIFYGQPSDPERAHAFIEQRLAHQESQIFLAMEADYGLGFTQLYPSFSSVAAQRIWILNDLFVAPTARRRGVAEALLTRAYQFAVETGARRLILSTAIDNIPAQSLYEKMGWQRDTNFFHYQRGV